MSVRPSQPKHKVFPLRPRSPLLAGLLQSCAVILAVNWCLQGMRGMERKELSFRLLFEAMLAAAALPALMAADIGRPAAMSLALLAAHSLNFTLNGQLWVCARYCRSYRQEPEAVEAFFRSTAVELQARNWLDEAVCIGSRGSRQAVSGERADLDVRLVFPPGPAAWLRMNLLLLRLRTRAFLGMIPLDLYAYDRPQSLRRFDQRERMLVILDRHGRLETLYPDRTVPWPG